MCERDYDCQDTAHGIHNRKSALTRLLVAALHVLPRFGRKAVSAARIRCIPHAYDTTADRLPLKLVPSFLPNRVGPSCYDSDAARWRAR